MADNDKENVEKVKEVAKKAKKSNSTFFKSNISALKIYTSQPKDLTDPQGTGASYVRFKPYYDVFKGDTVRVGYLEVEDSKVAKKVAEDTHVEEISEKEYKKAMDELRPAPIKVA